MLSLFFEHMCTCTYRVLFTYIVKYSIVQYSTVQYSTVQYSILSMNISMVQYNHSRLPYRHLQLRLGK